MKNYSLKPTEENVLELLRTNPIQRNPYVFRFAEMLSHMEDDCYSIALNGDWGSGKTFFVKQVKLLLDAANPQSGMPKETRRLIEAQIQTAAWPESYVTVYYDAWSYDNHDDPILSLIYATLQNGQGLDLSSNSGIRILNAATAVFDAVTGENLTALMNGLKGLRSEDKLSAIKKNKLIVQEHALVNITMLLPEVWGKLSSSDKWMIGETYRDVVASGDVVATKGLKLALGKVGGFDFVPETLRSTTFREMARKLIDVHDSFNNYYNETGVVKALANLGTRIPEPAFLVCLDAYLLVFLGNYYGYSRKAAPIAEEELKKISKDRWQAYFSSYIHTDDRILNNLETPTQVSRMRNLLVSIGATNFTELPKDNQKLFEAIMNNNSEKVKFITNVMYKKLV